MCSISHDFQDMSYCRVAHLYQSQSSCPINAMLECVHVCQQAHMCMYERVRAFIPLQVPLHLLALITQAGKVQVCANTFLLFYQQAHMWSLSQAEN